MGSNLVRARETVARRTLHDLVLDTLCAFREDNPHDDLVVLDTLWRPGTLEERHLQGKSIATGHGPTEKCGKTIIPTNAEAVIPPTKDGEAGMKLQLSATLRLPGTVVAGGDVTDVVDEVRVDGTRFQRVLDLASREGRQILPRAESPVHAVELVQQLRAVVVEPVALLGGQVPAPVGDLEVSFEQGSGEDGFGEVVADGDGVEGSRGDFGGVVWAVGVGCALAFGVGSGVGFDADCFCVVRYEAAGEL